jgi:hypothetical protein
VIKLHKKILKVDNAYITDAHFLVSHENKEQPVDVDFTKLNTTLVIFYSMGLI